MSNGQYARDRSYDYQKYATLEKCNMIKILCDSMSGDKGIRSSEILPKPIQQRLAAIIYPEINIKQLKCIKYDLGFFDGTHHGDGIIKIHILNKIFIKMETLTIYDATIDAISPSTNFAEMLASII